MAGYPSRTIQIGDYTMPQFTNDKTTASDLSSALKGVGAKDRQTIKADPGDDTHKTTHRTPGDDN